jgi:hypothetical protein
MKDKGIKELLNTSSRDVERHRLDMYYSLMKAIEEGGGSASSYKHYILEDRMSVVDLIDALGQNGVRFTYKKITE